MKTNFLKYGLCLVSFLGSVSVAQAAEYDSAFGSLQKTVELINQNVDSIPGTVSSVSFDREGRQIPQILYYNGRNKCVFSASILGKSAEQIANLSRCEVMSIDEWSMARVKLSADDVRRATYNLMMILRDEQMQRIILQNTHSKEAILGSSLQISSASAESGNSGVMLHSGNNLMAFSVIYNKDKTNNRLVPTISAESYSSSSFPKHFEKEGTTF